MGTASPRSGWQRVAVMKTVDTPRLGRLRQAQSRSGGPVRPVLGAGPVLSSRLASKPRLAPPTSSWAEREVRSERPRHWLERADACHRLEAHLFAVRFQHLRANKIGSVEALLMAYRHVFSVAVDALSLSFEQAVELAQRAERCEHDIRPWLSVSTCTGCGCDRIALLQGRREACPFCAVLTGQCADVPAPSALDGTPASGPP